MTSLHLSYFFINKTKRIMGKYYYGTHPDKNEAMKIADNAALRDRSAVCYTPSGTDGSCTFHEATALWTCKATAHYQPGSSNSHTINIFRESSAGDLPMQVPIDHISIEMFSALANTPPDIPGQEQAETYSDAGSEDYFRE